MIVNDHTTIMQEGPGTQGTIKNIGSEKTQKVTLLPIIKVKQ